MDYFNLGMRPARTIPAASRRLDVVRRRAAFAIASIVCAAGGFSTPADAANYTWSGATDALWATTTNWLSSAGGVPTTSDSVVFQGSSNVTVDYGNVTRTVANIANSGTGIVTPLTITATNGSLTINGANQAFGVQSNGNVVNDYSGLSAFTYTESTANQTFSVRMTPPSASPTSGTATLNLPLQGAGTSLIRATTTQIGAAAGSSAGTAWGGILGLGRSNTLNTNTFAIGGFNGSGGVLFQAGVTNGTLVVRGTAGGSARADKITIGETSSGTRDGSGFLDLTGGTIDLSGTSLLIGRHVASSNTPSVSGTFVMPGGSVDVFSLVVGEKAGASGTTAVTGLLTQGGGSVTSGTVRFGNILTTSGTTLPTFTSIYTLSSGTLKSALITTIPSVTLTATTTAAVGSVRRIAWSGGTIANYDASTDLTISGTNTNAGYTMSLVLGSTTTPQVFSADAGRTITIGSNAIVSGTGLLQKQGDGTLLINTAATYTGSTGISAGTVRLGITNGLPSNTALVMSPAAGTATLDLAGYNQTLGSLSSSGAGSAVVDVASSGTSTLIVGGDNTNAAFSGRLRNSGGATSILGITKNGTGTWTLTGSNSAVAGNMVFNAGKVSIDPGAAGSFTSTGRFQVLPGSGVTATVEVLSGSNAFSTAAGIGGLADNSATGTALWNLVGGTTTLALSVNRFLIGNKGTGTVTVSNNAVFTITGTPDLVIGGDQQYALNNATGVVTVSSGTLSITGTGNLVLGRNVSGTTTGANGIVNLDGGVFATVRPFTMASGSGTGTVNFNGGTLRALGASSDLIAVTTASVMNGGAVIDTNSFDVTIAQSLLNGGAGGLTKQGGGVLTLSASNSYIGATSVSGGTLRAGNVNAFGSAAITLSSGATLDLNSLAVANAVTNNGGTLANASSYAGTQSLAGSATYGGLAGTLSVVSGGAATLGGAVTGTVSIAAGGSATLAAGGSLAQSSLANNGTFTVNRNDNLSLGTVMSGGGGLVKLGSGTLTLTGSSTYTGPTTVSAGKLAVNGVLGSGTLSVAAAAWLAGTGTISGPVAVQGTLTPGSSPGLLAMQSLDLLSSSTTAMEIAGTTRGAGYDAVDIATNSGITYGGLLDLTFASAFPDNSTFDLFAFSGTPAGTFTSVTANGSYGSLTFMKQAGVWIAQSGSQTLSFTESTGNVLIVPEPATAALGGAAGIGLCLWAVRRRLLADRAIA